MRFFIRKFLLHRFANFFMEQLVLVVVNLRLEFHSVSFRCGLGEEFEFLDPELFLFIRLRFSLFWHRVRVLVRRPARDVRDTERSPAPRAGGHLQRRQWPVARAATAGAAAGGGARGSEGQAGQPTRGPGRGRSAFFFIIFLRNQIFKNICSF